MDRSTCSGCVRVAAVVSRGGLSDSRADDNGAMYAAVERAARGVGGGNGAGAKGNGVGGSWAGRTPAGDVVVELNAGGVSGCR